jgi:Polysaccharide pyruvyl transferase
VRQTSIVKTYFWKKVPNFGDQLTAMLLRRFSKLDSCWASPEESELITIGSILTHMPKHWRGVVAGAGKLHEKSVIDLPEAMFLAVRGPLSAKGLKKNLVLADPALLADELVGYRDKEYDLGLVPHWTDKTLALDPRFTKYRPKIIDVRADPATVLREISKCKKIVTSSLHGAIVADAFIIPRRIELAPRMLSHPHQEGGDFKWRDYSASLGMKFEPGVLMEADPHKVHDLQHELFEVFEYVKKIFR